MERSTEDLKITEQEILRLFREEATRQQGFVLLVNTYSRRLYWHIRKMLVDHDDTDDVLQNTFIKAWENLAGFREESKLYTWLYRIASNETLHFLRKKKSNLKESFSDVEEELGEKLRDNNIYNGNDIERKLQEAILTLPEKQRLVFNMRYFDEMKYEEMSAILGTSEGALKASYHHAVRKIEKFFGLD